MAGLAPEEECRALVERLGGRWGASGGICRCPAHEDQTPSLSIRPGRSRLLLHCFAGCSAEAVLRALEAAGLLRPDASGCSDSAPFGRTDGRSSEAARRIWAAGRSLGGTLAEAYLVQRGLRTSSPELRFHPRTPHGRHPLTNFRPALIAAVRDDAGLTGIHRTFLHADGTAVATGGKLGLGGFGRGAVRIGGVGPKLGLAEGIETALSATILFGLPCWAVLGAERFGRLYLPDGVSDLVLFLDHDAGGRRAEALARAAFGDRTRIEAHVPPRPGDDWNDVLRSLTDGETKGTLQSAELAAEAIAARFELLPPRETPASTEGRASG